MTSKARQRRQAADDTREQMQTANTPDDTSLEAPGRHVYDGERCIFCNTNMYDDGIYGPFPCIEREPFVYTTSTPAPDTAGN
jgi:hypothetical protein